MTRMVGGAPAVRCRSEPSSLTSARSIESSDVRSSPRSRGTTQRSIVCTASTGISSRSGGFLPYFGTWRRQFRSEEHTSELQSHHDLVCRLLLEKKKEIQARLLERNIIRTTTKTY